MPYSEYFNYSNGYVGASYSNAVNQCVVSYNNTAVYANYKNVLNTYYYGYSNYSNYSNYTNRYNGNVGYGDLYYTNTANYYANIKAYYYTCNVYTYNPNIYSDVPTNCQTYYNYTNHTDYANPNINGPLSLSYASPWNSGNLEVSYITDSINAIKNLRTNVLTLNNSKQHTATIDMFEEAELTGAKVISDSHYKKFKTTLDGLWNSLNNTDTGSGLPERIRGDRLDKVDMEAIKVKLDTLAATDSTTTYVNTISTYGYADANYSEYV